MAEAIKVCEELTNNKMNYSYSEDNRIGDHIWWVSDVRKFQNHYPEWKFQYGIKDILSQIRDELDLRLVQDGKAVNA